MFALALVLVIVGGFAFGFQSPTNTCLSRYIGSIEASTVSFAGGTLILAICLTVLGEWNLSGLADAQLWQYLGGVYGAFCVVMVTIAAPLLGIALMTTIVMFGQFVMGMLIDYFGWFGVTATDISTLRIVGCVIICVGIVLVYIGKLGVQSDKMKSKYTPIIVCLTFLNGVGTAIQSPTNASLALLIGSIDAAFISFVSGVIPLALIAVIMRLIGKAPEMKLKPIKPWMTLGGAYGAAGVLFNIIATPYLGVALLVAVSMLGQLTSGLLIDAFGWMRTAKLKMNAFRMIGVVLIAVGIVFVCFSKA